MQILIFSNSAGIGGVKTGQTIIITPHQSRVEKVLATPMDWLKKKKEEAKQAASQAAAKIQNKRTPAFKGEGNVLGGESAGVQSASPAAAPPPSRGFKVPAFGKSSPPPPVSEEEKQQRREAQLKALEGRTNAWDKRVNNARKARLQQEAELENKFELPAAPLASSTSTPSSPSSRSGPAPRVLSAEEMKAFEIQNAHAQVGFNPYAAVISSSTEANTVMNSMSSGQQPAPPPAPVPGRVASPPQAELSSGSTSKDTGGGVYVLLRQDPGKAIAAAETIVKMLSNIQRNPQEEKFRKIRLSNTSIQSKLVTVNGAVDLLEEAGFLTLVIDDEQYLVLTADAYDAARVQAVIDRTEVACIQLKVDSASLE